jgi:regulator of replication initiation timing
MSKTTKAELHDEASRLKADILELRKLYASLESAHEKVLAENEALRKECYDLREARGCRV